MPDITMCTGQLGADKAYATCPMRRTCYRYMARPNTRQSFMSPPLVVTDKGYECDSYWQTAEAYHNNLPAVEQPKDKKVGDEPVPAADPE